MDFQQVFINESQCQVLVRGQIQLDALYSV